MYRYAGLYFIIDVVTMIAQLSFDSSSRAFGFHAFFGGSVAE